MNNNLLFSRATFLKLSVILLIFHFAAGANGQEDRCGVLLKMGLYDETTSQVDLVEQRRLYKFVCEQQSSSMNETTTRSAEASYKLFSAGAKKGTNSMQEYSQQYCDKSEDEVFGSQNINSASRTANANVVDAWKQCIASEELGVKLDPSILNNQTAVTFSISYDDDELVRDAHLRGVRSRNMECRTTWRAGDSAQSDAILSANGIDGQAIKLTTAATVVTCERQPKFGHIDGREYEEYPADYLTLDLSTGAFNMDFVKRREGAVVDEFEDLQERISRLESKSQDLVVTLDNALRRLGSLFESTETSNNQKYSLNIAMNSRGLSDDLQPRKQMIAVNEGFCYLIGVSGSFAGPGERIWIELREGYWILRGYAGSQRGVTATAGCWLFPKTDTNPLATH